LKYKNRFIQASLHISQKLDPYVLVLIALWSRPGYIWSSYPKRWPWPLYMASRYMCVDRHVGIRLHKDRGQSGCARFPSSPLQCRTRQELGAYSTSFLNILSRRMIQIIKTQLQAL